MEWEVPSPCPPGFQEDRERGFLTGRVRHTRLCTFRSARPHLVRAAATPRGLVGEGGILGARTKTSRAAPGDSKPRPPYSRAPLSLNPDANRVCPHPLPGLSVALQDSWLTSLRWLLIYNELILSQRKAPCPALATEEKRGWGRHSANTSLYKATPVRTP